MTLGKQNLYILYYMRNRHVSDQPLKEGSGPNSSRENLTDMNHE